MSDCFNWQNNFLEYNQAHVSLVYIIFNLNEKIDPMEPVKMTLQIKLFLLSLLFYAASLCNPGSLSLAGTLICGILLCLLTKLVLPVWDKTDSFYLEHSLNTSMYVSDRIQNYVEVVKKAVDAETMKNIFCSDHVQTEK